MDLDSRAYSKLIELYYKNVDSGEYTRIVGAILPLAERHNHETPEMKILEENPRILSKNGYITMYEKLRVQTYPILRVTSLRHTSWQMRQGDV
ncbi:hypothetical protein RhiirC2_801968 [Rhizophagus irregularis]|uniref:Uncharacterized protein n=1 Tax=Rhizophagus irregularis TaxID=588596 RepID=A0A2N1M1R1_9GLOM|nr:hypothetical protein RhiirC2_801968 [Rhizophagus irregularis]